MYGACPIRLGDSQEADVTGGGVSQEEYGGRRTLRAHWVLTGKGFALPLRVLVVLEVWTPDAGLHKILGCCVENRLWVGAGLKREAGRTLRKLYNPDGRCWWP